MEIYDAYAFCQIYSAIWRHHATAGDFFFWYSLMIPIFDHLLHIMAI